MAKKIKAVPAVPTFLITDRPCPWCGGVAYRIDNNWYEESRRYICLNCPGPGQRGFTEYYGELLRERSIDAELHFAKWFPLIEEHFGLAEIRRQIKFFQRFFGAPEKPHEPSRAGRRAST